jgi:maltooligosyltrehalose trehalohydrolase
LKIIRNYIVGAEISGNEGVHFRVWAPGKDSVDVVLFENIDTPGKTFSLKKEEDGYYGGIVSSARAGTLYKFMLNGIKDYYPDPASRFQPFGPHGPSQVIDINSFKWSDDGWKGINVIDVIIYEMHIGTFTSGGTWRSAEERLEYLAYTGINLLEVMPVAEFPGEFGWGYDGVSLYAPTRLYGEPDDFKSFINTAHNLGIGVILDVVYNHFGPDGNYLGKYSDNYTTEKYKNDWGAAINYDGENSKPVRDFFKLNARYWIEEYHLDGLRLDATQNIYDESNPHILTEVQSVARDAAKGRGIFIVTENEPQDSILAMKKSEGGYGFDAMWNDDFHHSAMVALTGRREAYYTDYNGTPQEFISAFKYGFLYQGQHYKWQKQNRGKSAFKLTSENMVHFIQNHDQIANSGRGFRLDKLSSPADLRAMTAIMFLGRQLPMLFQGQEFGSSSPFLYFADHKRDLGDNIRTGRKEFLTQFRSIASEEMLHLLTDPGDKSTFEICKLDHSEVNKHSDIYKFHRDLIKLRRNTPFIKSTRIDGAVMGDRCFVIRYFSEGDDGLLFVNFGNDLNLSPVPEPLVAPVEGKTWELLWSSESPDYGGSGIAEMELDENWIISGHSAVLLRAVKIRKKDEKNNQKNNMEP